ncbi:hypothetical protein GCM10010129_30290 [Streptomyces fumigatiscleroticus]|nr:hypothetical protein GCM10010129_30290 [Streptomyces fumigatiscleroticus]
MFVDFRIDLSQTGLAFLAVLALGVLLVFLPQPLPPPLETCWLLPAAACLAAGGRGTTVRRPR